MNTVNRDGGLSRRRMLKATGAAALAAPFVARHSLASSGELNFMGWAGYNFKPIFESFTKETGIKVNFVEQPDQDAMVAQAKLGAAASYDISEPTVDRLADWVAQGFLQPIDEGKAGLSGIEPAFVTGAAGGMEIIDGKRYSLPSVWGTEALCFNKDEVKLEYGSASYGNIWDPAHESAVTVRPQSALVGIGLWLEGEGKLPKPFIESFKSPDSMTANYDVIIKTALEHKGNVAQFWKDENSAQGAFRTNGCVIGQNWDTTAAALMKEGLPIAYLAPKEGALAWLQNFVLLKGAKNVEQAYAFLKFMATPDASAAWAKAFGANPVAKGAGDKMPAETAAFLKAAYPGDALKKLWWWPSQPTWFVAKRNQYADQFQAG